MSFNINILRRITPRWVVFTIDITISFLSIVFAYYLRFNFTIPQDEINDAYNQAQEDEVNDEIDTEETEVNE